MFPVIPAGGSGAYNLQRSLRFRSGASAYLTRTPAGAGNRTTWTWSGWVKRGALGVRSTLFSVVDSTGHASFQLESDNTLIWNCFTAANGYVQTSAVLRDPSAHYHVVLAFNDTLATSTDRVKVFVNGMQQTFSVYTAPTQNQNTPVSNTVAQYIGVQSNLGGYFDGLLSEVNFIDGQALDASYFGATDPATGQWQPKKYTGAYGTNGFYLPFTDNSALTTSSNVGLGKDFSGNGNYWTTNNISLTAGATYDSFTDVPTLTGPTASNFATLNPLVNEATGGTGTLTNGNLTWTTNTTTLVNGTRSTIASSTGKIYLEFQLTLFPDAGIGYIYIPVMPGCYITFQYGAVYQIVGDATTNISAWVNGDTLNLAADLSSGKVWFGKNGTWYTTSGTPDPVAGTGAAHNYTGGSKELALQIQGRTGSSAQVVNVNFGQRPFTYTPPAGYQCLNTFNLPDPVIKKPNQYFDVTTFTGTGATQGIVNSGVMQPDLVWAKGRSAVSDHWLADSVRGANNILYSDLTNAETVGAGVITAFNSNGFNTSSAFANAATYAAWQWKKGATPGFDVVAFTAPALGAGGVATYSHSLGVAPAMMIMKPRSAVGIWVVWHKAGVTGTNYLSLDSTAAIQTATYGWGVAPTSSQFSMSSSLTVNSATYIAYLWAEIPGFSKFGSYIGNWSTDGPFVYCGFRPKFVMWKRTDAVGNWEMHDVSRSAYNVANEALWANLSNAEAGSGGIVDALSNGFKLRVISTDANASGGTYIYAAFAEAPTKYANAR